MLLVCEYLRNVSVKPSGLQGGCVAYIRDEGRSLSGNSSLNLRMRHSSPRRLFELAMHIRFTCAYAACFIGARAARFI